MMARTTALAVVLACCASLASAQQPLRLQITSGRVTLHAQNVPVRTILAEWARLGGAKIVNGERITSPPVTLDLENIPERQALDIILRGVSGYVLAARVGDVPGASMYDRIMILPTSVAPRTPAPATAPVFNAAPGTIRPGIPRLPAAAGNDADNSQDDSDNDGVPLARPVPIPRPVIGAPIGASAVPPVPIIAGDGDSQPAIPPVAPSPVVTTPSNPFGVPAGSSARPGVVAPAPQPQQTQPQGRPRNGQD
jgi:hypothetical protein